MIDNGAFNNTIGGTGAGAGNVISGNSGDGIDIGSFSPTLSSGNGNLVQGNKIGTNAAGTAELGNGSAGVRFVDGMSNTVENNVISGNVNEGIFFHGNDGASDEMVLDNLVGTNFDGTAEIPNGLDGISLLQSAGNTIGGNVISGNGNPSRTAPMSRNGIKLAGADDNLIQANLIGTDASGTRAMPNISDGVFVSGSNNTIGGTTDNDRNVISGNGNDGVEMTSGASNNAVLGNYIGVGAGGTTPLGNVLDGVSIASGATSNTIGGTAVGAGNVISGNGNDGVDMISGESNNAVLGNYIGVGADGTTPLGNVLDGISLNNASSNSIIGNVVSDNGINQDAAGINLEASDLNSIAGNKIGTDMSGNKALGNSLHGIFLGNGSSNNTIGGPTDNDRNVISGNGQFPVANLATQGSVGVYIYGANTSGNVVQGNYIGTNAAGNNALTNSVIGVLISQSSGNTVQGNLISGNRFVGLEIAGGAGGTASGNLVQGNKIGTNFDGTAAIPNGLDGITINNAPNNLIGGTTAGAGNLISGNGSVGIQLFGPLTQGNVIEGNALGLDSAGRPTLPNRAGGIFVNTGPLNNQVGGTARDQANRGQTRQQLTVTGFHQSHAGSKTRHSPPAGRRFRIRGRARTSLRAHSTAH